MQSQSRLSPEHTDDSVMMRRRFVEALRRAEIISILNEARDERSLGRRFAEEICEAFEAEVAFVADCGGEEDHWRVIESVGLAPTEVSALAATGPALELAEGIAVPIRDPSALIEGGMSAVVCLHSGTDSETRVAAGVVRLSARAFEPAERGLLESVTASATHALERQWTAAERDRLLERTKASFVGTAEALAAALEAKDDYTADHARAIADLAVEVGRELGLAGERLEDLRYGAIFHDIGKIAIPDAILNKNGPLDDEEFEVIKTHPVVGERILAPIPFLSDRVRQAVRHDHERWDGGGYPDGLKGGEIPLEARIVFVVDAYHAMTSDRPYRAAMDVDDARDELRQNAGSQFDPNVVSAFLRVLDAGVVML